MLWPSVARSDHISQTNWALGVKCTRVQFKIPMQSASCAAECCFVFVPHICAIKSKQLHKKSFSPVTTVTCIRAFHSPLSLSSGLSDPVRLNPLSQFTEAWRILPGISACVLNTIISSNTLQFAHRPPWFNAVVMPEVQASNASVF